MKKLFTVGLSCLLLSSLGAADVLQPDPDGYIRHWLILAPIALPEGETGAEAIFRQQIRDESALRPTVGDKVRLADTELIIEVEKDFTVYGEEVKFGGGKVIRDGMGQSQVTRANGAMDTVITNALIVDHWGIVKADVGLRDGDLGS